jgi:ribosome-associated heat shock protein Hsp15
MQELSSVRVDKWLWAARFFKTRSLASTAVEAGHVLLDKAGIKPAKMVKKGDCLTVRTEQGKFEITILALSAVRGSASIARLLYDESMESQQKREQEKAEKQLAPRFVHPQGEGRPSKKWRRQLHEFERKNNSDY